jgi:hypothetical protein
MLFSWAQEQNFWGGWRPESREVHDLFLGELYWAPAYEEIFSDSRGESAWARGHRAERFPTDGSLEYYFVKYLRSL